MKGKDTPIEVYVRALVRKSVGECRDRRSVNCGLESEV